MLQGRLGERGPQVSRLGLGCMGMTYSYGGRDEAEAVTTLHRAVERGVTLFDTADMYGPWTNEELVGRALHGRREQVVLASKFGQEVDADGSLTGRVNGRPDYLRRALDGSLRRLGVECIDLYYQHRVDPEVPIEETWGALGEAAAQGKVRHLGISEAAPETLRRAHAAHPITALQYEYSLFSREVETDGVLAAARELGIAFVAYSPLGRGILTGAIRDASDLPEGDSRPDFPRFAGDNLARNNAIVERLRAVAQDKGATPAQLALAWVLAQGEDVIAIPGTKRPGHLDQNLQACDITLTPEDLAAIDAVAPPGSAAGDRYPPGGMHRLRI